METRLIVEDLINPDGLIELQRRSTYAERRVLADEIAGRVNAHLAAKGICRLEETHRREEDAHLEALNLKGYATVGRVLEPGQIEDVLAYFKETPCFNAHLIARSDQVGRWPGAGAEDYPFGSFRLEDVIEAPHLLELANSPAMLSLAAGYLGCTPSLYSLNAWWSFPGHPVETRMTQGFHRDEDDFKNCVLLLYLTDTNANTGAHEYIRATHRQDLTKNLLEGTSFPVINLGSEEEPNWVRVEFEELFAGTGYDGDAVYAELFGPQIDMICGQSGEAFFSDPAGLHRARPPLNSARLIVWIRYGYYANKSYKADQLYPVEFDWGSGAVPDTARHRYINRLVLQS